MGRIKSINAIRPGKLLNKLRANSVACHADDLRLAAIVKWLRINTTKRIGLRYCDELNSDTGYALSRVYFYERAELKRFKSWCTSGDCEATE